MVDKNKNQIGLDEYHVRKINFVHASQDKILEELDDSTQAFKDELKKVEEGYKKQKREVRALCQYINDLPLLVREEGPSFIPPRDFSTKVVDEIDRSKCTAQRAKVLSKEFRRKPLNM